MMRFSIPAILFFTLALYGCSKTSYSLNGNWTATEDLLPGISEVRMSFDDDKGIARIAQFDIDGEATSLMFAYERDGELLWLRNGDSQAQITLAGLSPNRLEIEWDGQPLVLHRR